MQALNRFDFMLVVHALLLTSPVLYYLPLKQGAHLPGLLGYEVDGLADSSPPNVMVIARSPVGSTFASSILYQAASGAFVFNAGSMQWIWGLDDFRADPFDRSRMNQALQQMTRQLLAQLGRAPEPTLAHGGRTP